MWRKEQHWVLADLIGKGTFLGEDRRRSVDKLC